MFLDLTAYKWHKSSHLSPSDQTLSCNLSVCTSCTSLFPPRPSPPLSSAKPAGAVMLEELRSSNNRVIRGIDCGGRRVKKKKSTQTITQVHFAFSRQNYFAPPDRGLELRGENAQRRLSTNPALAEKNQLGLKACESSSQGRGIVHCVSPVCCWIRRGKKSIKQQHLSAQNTQKMLMPFVSVVKHIRSTAALWARSK